MEVKPLAVPPSKGFDLLGVGTTKGYELINSGELETFTIGRARRITMVSIERYIERQLANQAEAA